MGDTHTIQALSVAGQSVTGLAWTSSNPNVVSLSTDDPPVLTSLAAGHVTIIAGTAPNAASADVTVFAGPLPIGTVIWSNPGDGSGVQSIVPAVPSTTGVADVFAFQNDGTVQAITSDGTVAWTAQTNYAYGIPDFQGGLIVGGANGIYKLDGITGQPYPAFNGGAQGRWGIPCGGNVLVHPDGTIFAAKGVGVDPTTGTQKFSVPAPAANIESSYDAIIAGDGYAYFPYVYVTNPDGYPFDRRLAMLRVDSSGANDNFDVYEWESWTNDAWCYRVNMITNADQGILFTWANPEASASGDGAYMPHMAVTTGASASVVSPPQLPGGGQVYPVLQAQDGSYVGTACQGCAPGYGGIVSFDGTGNTRWIVPTDYPQIATDDGGVIGQSGITYDQNGNATGIAAGLPTYSWTGNAYQQDGPVEQISADLLFVLYDVASSFWAIVGGNYSGNETAYALIRTFSDNVVDANIVVTNPSQTDPNQQAITNVLSDISRALNTGSNGGCSAWLTGTATSSVLWTINSMITYQLYGHGTFEAGTAAFLGWKNQDGTLTGTPAGWAITVNDQGAFFNANLGDKTFTVGRRAYKGGTLKAQAAILIHELGHSMNAIGGAAGFQVDAGNKPAGRANDSLVDKYCGKLIESLK